MRRPIQWSCAAAILAVAIGAPAVSAQAPAESREAPAPRPAPPPARPRGLEIGGYVLIGSTSFAAADTFDAVFGKSKGTTFGGGVSLGLPWGGLFVQVGAWRFTDEGQRVFVSGGQVFRLGIPVRVSVTPFEVTGGWRFRGLSRRFTPYAGAGLSSYAYRESSDFSAAGEDVRDRFPGYHVLGGGEFKVSRWLGLAGEATWATVPKALGDAGVSAAFGESDLGGTSVRFKVTVGR